MAISTYRPIVGAILTVTLALASMAVAAPATVDAASCVRISGAKFDAPGNDNNASNLNGEYVRIKNYCSSRISVSGWRLHDYGKKHTYTFATGFSIKSGVTVTVYSGRGTDTSTKKYWGFSYGAVWNNDPPERAYLRNSVGTLMSSWAPATAVAPPTPSCAPNYRGYCVPIVAYDLDCPDIGHQVYVIGVDIHRFDGDGDGVGCESY